MRVEKILIKPNHAEYRQYKRICRFSKAVFNCALYYKRQAFFRGESIKFSSLDQLVKIHHKDLYDSLPNAGSQAIIKKLCTDFDSFWAALREWKVNPGRFKAKPQLPKYKKEGQLKTFLMPSKPIPVKEGHIILPKKMGVTPVVSRFAPQRKANSSCPIFKEVRVVPHGSCFWIEIAYDETQVSGYSDARKHVKLNPDNAMGIDLGVNILMAVTSTQAGFNPILVNGKPIKSINQYFNKQKAVLASKGKRKQIHKLTIRRYNQINDYFHKCSNKVLQLCLESDIGHVIIGHNEGLKQSINIGKRNNQKFVSIPHGKLIGQLQYKLASYGIKVSVREESYTSKADALACDNVPDYIKDAKVKHKFSGKRKKRGLYQSSIGKLINADVNGSLNIIRKEVSNDSFVKRLVASGRVFRPTYWSPMRPARGKPVTSECSSVDPTGDNQAPSIAA